MATDAGAAPEGDLDLKDVSPPTTGRHARHESSGRQAQPPWPFWSRWLSRMRARGAPPNPGPIWAQRGTSIATRAHGRRRV